MLGRAIETVRCRTTDLEAPASAEILIEGHVALDETATEGPIGEYAGYLRASKGRQRPIYHVTALRHRDDPILPVVVAGEPVEENHTAWAIPCAAMMPVTGERTTPANNAPAPTKANVLHSRRCCIFHVPRPVANRSQRLSRTQAIPALQALRTVPDCREARNGTTPSERAPVLEFHQT